MDQAGDLQKNQEVLHNLKKILQHTNFCTFCLDINEDLFCLDECRVKGHWGGEELLMKDMLDGVFGKANDYLISGFICKPCLSSAINCYTFITRSKRTVGIYSEYLSQLDNKVTDLVSLLDDNDEFKNTYIILENIHSDNILDKSRINKKSNNKINVKSIEETSKELKDVKFIEVTSKEVKDVKCKEVTSKEVKDVKKLIEVTLKKIQRKPTHICDLCGKEYIQKRSLKKHLSKHKSEAFERIDCPRCKKRPCAHEKYLAHVDRQMAQQEEKISCPECNEQIRSTSHLIAHVNNKHLHSKSGRVNQPHTHFNITKPKENVTRVYKSYACLICHMYFKTIRERVLHFREVHKKKPNFCEFCNKSCDSREEFLKHAQTQEHRDNAPNNMTRHQCTLCDHSTANRAALMAHVNRVHLKIRPFKCQYCTNSYFSSTLLKLHLKIHTGEELKVCDICGLTLSGRRSLKKHKMVHMGETPYSCPYCEHRANCSSALQTHIVRKHTEASIACPLCDSKYYDLRCVRVHIRKVHWKSSEKFDHTKLKGLSPKDYHLFEDRRKAAI